MVQLNVYMYALASIASEISELKTETVPTGLGGVYGNKGKENGDKSSAVYNYRENYIFFESIRKMFQNLKNQNFY